MTLTSKVVVTTVIGLLLCFFVVAESHAQEFWADTHGGSGNDWVYRVQQTTDEGYIVTGPVASFGQGGYDIWVMKLDSSGNVVWEKAYGGTADDIPNTIQQTTDGGYIVAGRTSSFGAGGFDFFVLRLDPTGNVLWFNTYGGTSDEYLYAIRQTFDLGFIVAGGTTSFGAGSFDYWILKLNASGNTIWQKACGGSSIDIAYTLNLTYDGGYIVAGGSVSYGSGGYDYWILKLDSTGTVLWQNAYGGFSDDIAFSIQQTADPGIIVAGRSDSYGMGNIDYWILKLNATGSIIWQNTYGGIEADWPFSIQQTPDNNYIVGGRTDSFGAGNADFWIIKLDSTGGTVEWQKTYGGSSMDYAYSIQQTTDGSYIAGGVTASFGAGSYDMLVLKLEPTGEIGNSCSISTDTSAFPSPTSTTVQGTNMVPVNTNVTAVPYSPTTLNTSASTSTLCYFNSLPGEVLHTLFLSKTGVNPVLDWQSPAGTCNVSGYGIYRGSLPIVAYDHVSRDCTVTNLNYTDTTSTGNHYYLVVPLNTLTEGSYGTDYDGTERPIGSSSCLPQNLNPCN